MQEIFANLILTLTSEARVGGKALHKYVGQGGRAPITKENFWFFSKKIDRISKTISSTKKTLEQKKSFSEQFAVVSQLRTNP